MSVEAFELREELFAAKQELSDKLAENAELERELSDTRKQLKTARQEAENLNETVRKLQRMSENTAEQSVLGYKSELARSLKSLVEEVSIPEAQGDADILSALLGGLIGRSQLGLILRKHFVNIISAKPFPCNGNAVFSGNDTDIQRTVLLPNFNSIRFNISWRSRKGICRME